MELKRDLSLITLLTVFSYAIAYLFQFSILKYYGAPIDFISVDLNSLLTAMFFVGVPAYFMSQSFIVLGIGAKDTSFRKFSYGVNIFFGLNLALAGALCAKFIFPEVMMWGRIGVGLVVFVLYIIVLIGLFVILLLPRTDEPVGEAIPWAKAFLVSTGLTLVLLAPLVLGGSYAQINVGSYTRYATSEFFIMENSKGALFVKCSDDVNAGLVFIRLKSEDTQLVVNKSKQGVDKLKNCLKTDAYGL